MANIVVVDDDEIVQKTIRASLVKAGHTVLLAKDAFAGLEFTEKESVNLLITDINLPMGFNGFKLTKAVREKPDINNIPILMISTRRSEEDVIRGIECGIDDYIIKPIDYDIFLAKVSSLLNRGGHSFLLSRIKSKGHLTTKVEMDIIGISEEGLQFLSNVPLEVNAKTVLDSFLFSEIGIAQPNLRIAHCEKIEAENQGFNIKANFIGLSPGDLQKVRVYMSKIRFKSAA